MKRPVLILGWVPRIVTTVARSLHAHGVPVDVADFTTEPRPYSGAIRNFKRLPRPDVPSSDFVDELRRFIRQNCHDMLIPIDDLALAAVTDHYEQLHDILHVACPPPAVTNRVLNKVSTLEIARQCGVAVPETHIVSNSSQLLQFDSRHFPLVLKPAKRKWGEKFKTSILTKPEDISRNFPACREFTPPLLVQEYCEGVGLGIEMLMHHGNCVAVFQHRRLKEVPYSGGFAVAAVAESPDPVLTQKSLALLRALDWEGVAMVEFRVNGGGPPVLMEINGRYWGSISLPVLAGMDFPLHHWKLVHGEEPEILPYVVGTRWRWTVGYVGRLHGLLVASRHSPAARKIFFESLREIPSDFRSPVRDAVFSAADPFPAIIELARSGKFYFSYHTKRVLERLALSRRDS